MPEGDTVFLSATRLHHALAGDTLIRTDFRVPRIATADLSKREVLEVTSRGKHILMRIAGGVTLHTHFKMEGAWDLYRSGERWHGPAWQVRVVLETQRWVAVGFRLPIVELIDSERECEVVGHLGPDPLREWDSTEAGERLRRAADTRIGEALLDQRLIAGLGNVYKSEVCFLRGIHPDTRVEEVSDLEAVVDLSARLLQANRATGRQITTGDARRGRERWVYGRGGRPCRRCGTPIEKAEQQAAGGPRVTYWCPSCQPAPKAPG
ncbi:MAG: DNA glycosylase [Actinomycetota bacterium]|nr:DNA glycosylase [Actinomycetota bacterium]